MEPAQIVDAFLEAIARKDLDTAIGFAAEDIEYDNVPMPTVHGHAGMREFLQPLVDGVDEVQIIVHRQVADGDVVMNERLDRFRVGEKWIDLPVAGVMQIRDGKIVVWRDFFDLQTLNEGIAALAGG